MKIVICPKCGRKIHLSEKCLYCGNNNGFQLVGTSTNIHNNVVDEYEKLSELLTSRAFDKVIEISRLVLKWMPTCAEVFWMRMLAKNQCSSDAELAQKGIVFDESADYFNAVRYASSIEQEVYEEVEKLVKNICSVFEKAVTQHEYEEKRKTSILCFQSEFSEKISNSRKKLFDLYSQLEQIEQKIYIFELDWTLLINEHKEALDKIRIEAQNVYVQTSKLDGCTTERLHNYQVCLDSLLNQSNQSKSKIEVINSQCAWNNEYKDMVQERDGVIELISNELSSLKSYEKKAQSIIIEIEKIEREHQLTMYALSNYDFLSTYLLLGARKYEEVLTSAGLTVISTNVGHQINN